MRIHDAPGSLRRLPASWTSVGALDPFVVVAAGRAHFRVTDLLELAALVRTVHQAVQGEEGGENVSSK